MKFKITTVYSNVDQKWLDWWLSMPIPPGMPIQMIEALEELKQGAIEAAFTSKDPTSEVHGTTTYEVLK